MRGVCAGPRADGAGRTERGFIVAVMTAEERRCVTADRENAMFVRNDGMSVPVRSRVAIIIRLRGRVRVATGRPGHAVKGYNHAAAANGTWPPSRTHTHYG